MENKIILMIIITIIATSLTSAWNIDYFNNSHTSENLTFINNQNITRFIGLPVDYKITYLTINLSSTYEPHTNVSTNVTATESGLLMPSQRSGIRILANKNFTIGSISKISSVTSGASLVIRNDSTDNLFRINSSLTNSNLFYSNFNFTAGKYYWLEIANTNGVNWYHYCNLSVVGLPKVNEYFNITNGTFAGTIYASSYFCNIEQISISNYPGNLTVSLNQTNVFNNTGDYYHKYNNTNNFAWNVNNYVQNCSFINGTCNLPIVFHSDRNGTLNIKNIYMSNNAQYSFNYGTTTLYPECNVINGNLSSSYYYTAGNSTTETITCTLNAYRTLNVTYNVSDGDKQFNMSADSILIYFNLYNGTRTAVSGYWTDGTQTQNFSGYNLTIYTLNLTEGITKVFFGNSTINLMNYTQFYDFERDWISETIENLTLITPPFNKIYIKTLAEGGEPIKDTLIRLSISSPFIGGSYKEIGQRFTGHEGIDGTTYFYVPDNSNVLIRATKDGWGSYNQTINVLNSDYDLGGSLYPYTIQFKRDLVPVYKGVKVSICQYYNNDTEYIPLSIYAPSRSTVQFYTSYDATLRTISLNLYKNGRYNFASPGLPEGMIQGREYCSGCTDDLNVTFIIDGQTYNTYTIKYRAIDETRNTEPISLSPTFYYKLVWIGLIMFVGVLGFMFKTNEESEGTGGKGKVLFLIGCGIIPLVFNGTFYYLLLVSVFYGIGILLKKWIGE